MERQNKTFHWVAYLGGALITLINLTLAPGCGRALDAEEWSESTFALLGGALMLTEDDMELTQNSIEPSLQKMLWARMSPKELLFKAEDIFIPQAHALEFPEVTSATPQAGTSCNICPKRVFCEQVSGEDRARLVFDLDGCWFVPRVKQDGPGLFFTYMLLEIPDIEATKTAMETCEQMATDLNNANDGTTGNRGTVDPWSYITAADSWTWRKRFGQRRYLAAGTPDNNGTEGFDGDETNDRIGADASCQQFYTNFPSGFWDSDVEGGLDITFKKLADNTKVREIKIRGAQAKELWARGADLTRDSSTQSQNIFEDAFQSLYQFPSDELFTRACGTPVQSPFDTPSTLTTNIDANEYMRWHHTHDTRAVPVCADFGAADCPSAPMTGNHLEDDSYHKEKNVPYTNFDDWPGTFNENNFDEFQAIQVVGSGEGKYLPRAGTDTVDGLTVTPWSVIVQHNISKTIQVIRYPTPSYTGKEPQKIVYGRADCCWPTEGSYSTNFYIGPDGIAPDYRSTHVQFTYDGSTCGQVTVTHYVGINFQGESLQENLVLSHCY